MLLKTSSVYVIIELEVAPKAASGIVFDDI